MNEPKLPEGVARWTVYMDRGRPRRADVINGEFVLFGDLPAIIAANLPAIAQSAQDAMYALEDAVMSKSDQAYGVRVFTARKALLSAIAADRQRAVDEEKAALELLLKESRSLLQRAEAAERERDIWKRRAESSEAVAAGDETLANYWRQRALTAERRLSELEKAGPDEIDGMLHELIDHATAVGRYGEPSAIVNRNGEHARILTAIGAMQERLEKVTYLLRDLHATVMGECPSLLDGDRGGSDKLALAIDAALEGKSNGI